MEILQESIAPLWLRNGECPKMASWKRLVLVVMCLAALVSLPLCLAMDGNDEDVEPMTEKTAYKILGVDKWTTDKEIKRIFKEKSLILHPDKEEGSEEAFKELRIAYETLIDPERRIVLDELDGKGFDHPNEVEVLGEDLELSDFYGESRNIVKIDNSNILSLLWRKEAWVVEFYVPWCTYCQNMAPKWKLLTTKYAQSEYVRFGAVNCMKQQPMCDRYPFTLVPTFMCFHSDKDYHTYEGIPDEEKIDEFIQKCEDDYKVHLENGDPVFDKFMVSGGGDLAEVDPEADDYDYDLGDDLDDGGAEQHKPAAKQAASDDEDDDFVLEDFLEESQGSSADGDEDYDYELIDDENEVVQEAVTKAENTKGIEASPALEEENRRLKEELDAMKERMEGMEEMVAKMKTLFA